MRVLRCFTQVLEEELTLGTLGSGGVDTKGVIVVQIKPVCCK